MINMIEGLFNREDQDAFNATENNPVNKKTKTNFEQIYSHLRTSKKEKEDDVQNSSMETEHEILSGETEEDEQTIKDGSIMVGIFHYPFVQTEINSLEEKGPLDTDLAMDISPAIDETSPYISTEDMTEEEVSNAEISDFQFSFTEVYTSKEDLMSIEKEQSIQGREILHNVDEFSVADELPDTLSNVNAEVGHNIKEVSVQGLNGNEETFDRPNLNQNISDVDDSSQIDGISTDIGAIEIQDTTASQRSIERDRPKIKIDDHRAEGFPFQEALDEVSSDGMWPHSLSSDEGNNFAIDNYESMDIVHRLSEEIYANLQEDRSEMVVHLKPEFLGKVTLKISLNRDVLSARIVTESYATRDIISTQLDDLKHTLGEKGYTIGNLDVDINQSDSQPHRSYNEQQNYLRGRTNNQLADIEALGRDLDYKMKGYTLSSANAGNIDYFA